MNSAGFSQEEFKYSFQADLGVGGTLFWIPTSLQIKVNDGPRGFATTSSLDLNFNVKRPFSIGLSFLHNSYATEKDSNTNFIDARGNTLLFISNYHLIDNKKFNLSIGSGIGVNGLNYSRTDISDSTIHTGKVRLEGSSFALNLHMRYYFIKNLGIFLRSQYSINNTRAKSFILDGQSKDRIGGTPLNEVIHSFRGTLVQVGLSFRF